jgi:hypothetical protein
MLNKRTKGQPPPPRRLLFCLLVCLLACLLACLFASPNRTCKQTPNCTQDDRGGARTAGLSWRVPLPTRIWRIWHSKQHATRANLPLPQRHHHNYRRGHYRRTPVPIRRPPTPAPPDRSQGYHGQTGKCGAVLGARCLVLGARCSVLGAWCSVLGARCSVLGARCSVCGLWCAVCGEVHMVCSAVRVRCAALCCVVVRWCAVRCGVLRCVALGCRAVPCRAVPCRSVPCRAVPCRAVPCRALRCGAVRCGAVPCGAVRGGAGTFAVRCMAVRCGVVMQYCYSIRYGIAIRYSKVFGTALHKLCQHGTAQPADQPVSRISQLDGQSVY